MVECEFDGHTYYSCNVIKGCYSWFEKKYGVKLTRALLVKAGEKGMVKGGLLVRHTARVYSESNIITAFMGGEILRNSKLRQNGFEKKGKNTDTKCKSTKPN